MAAEINITDRAAEKIKKLLAAEKREGQGLRLKVVEGGTDRGIWSAEAAGTNDIVSIIEPGAFCIVDCSRAFKWPSLLALLINHKRCRACEFDQLPLNQNGTFIVDIYWPRHFGINEGDCVLTISAICGTNDEL